MLPRGRIRKCEEWSHRYPADNFIEINKVCLTGDEGYVFTCFVLSAIKSTYYAWRKAAAMKLRKRTIIILAFLIVFFAVIIIVKNIGDKPKNVLKILPDHIDLQIKDFVYTEVGAANSKWEVKAQTAQYHKKQNLVLFDKVQIKLTTEEKKVYVMTGDNGQMLTDKKDLEIKGNVVIVSESGDRFTTEYLKYSESEKKFYTDAPVSMENEKMKIKGKGLTLFMNTGELNLRSAVKAKIN